MKDINKIRQQVTAIRNVIEKLEQDLLMYKKNLKIVNEELDNFYNQKQKDLF